MYGPVAAILITLLAYFASQLFGGIVVGSLAGAFGYDSNHIVELFENSTLWQFLFILSVEVFALLIIGFFVRRRTIPLKYIGLGRRPVWGDAGRALLSFGAYFIVLIVILKLISTLVPSINLDQQQELNFETTTHGPLLALVFAGLVILPAVTEEIMVRGFLYSGLRTRLRKLTAALIASALFGVAHLQLGSGAVPLWVAAIDTFVLSLVLIELRERSGALWAGMFVHALKNTLAFISLFILMN